MPNLLLKMSAPKKQFFLNRLASPSNCLAAIRNLSCTASLILGVVAPSTAASAQTSTLYRLNKDSTFQQGCFPPCLCPIMIAVPVKGTFVLTPTGFDGLFDAYTVTDVNWLVLHLHVASQLPAKHDRKDGAELLHGDRFVITSASGTAACQANQ